MTLYEFTIIALAHSIKSEPSDPRLQRLARSEGEGSTTIPDSEKERVKLERGLPHRMSKFAVTYTSLF